MPCEIFLENSEILIHKKDFCIFFSKVFILDELIFLSCMTIYLIRYAKRILSIVLHEKGEFRTLLGI